MSFRRDRDILRVLGSSFGLMAAGAVLWVFSNQVIGVVLILGGALFTVMGFYTATQPKEDLLQDERSIRIREKAGSLAFFAILILSATLNLLQYAGVLEQKIMSITLITSAGLFIYGMLMLYYNKKGE